jgi:hypothetical protein
VISFSTVFTGWSSNDTDDRPEDRDRMTTDRIKRRSSVARQPTAWSKHECKKGSMVVLR